jgi:nitrite reductase/ring-hydroxylating ferredoxin subunit
MSAPIARVNGLVDGEARAFEADVQGLRRECVLLRVGGELHAFVNTCAHRRQPVVVDRHPVREDGTIECEAHGAVYDARSGECIEGPCEGARLRAVALRLEGDDVFAADDPVDDSGYASGE